MKYFQLKIRRAIIHLADFMTSAYMDKIIKVSLIATALWLGFVIIATITHNHILA